MKDFTAIVLAAGKGVRMKSPLPKVLHKIRGKPLIGYVLEELAALKFIKQIIVVVGYKGKEVESYVKENFPKASCVYQKKLLGTADAVKPTQHKVKYNNVLILCADAPLVTRKTIFSFLHSYVTQNLPCSLITAYVESTNEFGRIVRDDSGRVKAIVEKIVLEDNKKTNQLRKDTKEVNSGIYAFDRETLFENLNAIQINPNKREYFFTDIVEIMYNRGYRIGACSLSDPQEMLGINNQRDLCMAEKILYKRVVDKFLDEGVRIIDPQSTFIDEGVRIGKGTIIYPFTFIQRNVIIAANCVLGPFIHLREGTYIAAGTHLGNFIEICRSRIGKNVRAKHFGYLGDTTVGDNVNIGAGTVVANFDGKNKNKTAISKNAFIGSDTVLVAPVNVGKYAVTGAGSVVTKNVKPRTIVVGVPAKLFKKKK
ncbi:MAG: sugar phosphate nucleotidyltransferase [Candidatus Omnitrophota bacterium]|nr:sugar phosphate nucleotidyltransferase [Candidatus Omnitrophota bacterium]